MLTLFALPKTFKGHIEVIQRNAILSWLRLRPACEIILLGDNQGTAEVAAEFKLHHIPTVARNDYGTPLVNSLFAEAEKAAAYPLLCYVNADIIFMSDLLPAVQLVIQEKPRSLMVGSRWDLDLKETLDFKTDWEQRLRSLVDRLGKLHGHSGIDYFVYPKGLWGAIPPFAIGRSVWDSWLLYHAHSQKIPVVDLTAMVTVVHQNHDYSHHPQQRTGVWNGSEAQQNLKLAGGIAHAYTLLDAQYHLKRKGVRRRRTPYYFYRSLVTTSESYGFLKPLVKLIRFIRTFLDRNINSWVIQ